MGNQAAEEKFLCELCGRLFAQMKALTKHQTWHRTSPAADLFLCEMCGRPFTQAASLNRHQTIHCGNKAKLQQCNICHKSFSDLSHLRQHRRVHTQEKPFPCDICGRSFSQTGNLTRHKKIHVSHTTIDCMPDSREEAPGLRHCDVTSYPSDRLKELRHKDRLASLGVDFVCDICQSDFPTVGDLIRHYTIQCMEELNCDLCNKMFTSDCGLERCQTDSATEIVQGEALHQVHQKHIKEEKPSVLCDEPDSSHANYRSRGMPAGPDLGPNGVDSNLLLSDSNRTDVHVCCMCHQVVKRHDEPSGGVDQSGYPRPFVCLSCNKDLSHTMTQSNMLHVQDESKPFKCEYCWRTFRHLSHLKQHVRVHTNEKPFACDVCFKAFSQAGTLSRHKSLHTKPKESNSMYHSRKHEVVLPFVCQVCNKGFARASSLCRHRSHHASVY